MSDVKLFRLSGSTPVIDLRTGNNATLRPGLVVLSEDAHTHAIASLEAELAKLRAGQEPVEWRCRVAGSDHYAHFPTKRCRFCEPLYTAPQPSAVPDEQFPPCDYCGKVPDYHPWHGSGLINGRESPHIHACNECRLLLPSAPATVQGVNAQLLEAATGSLAEIQAVMQEAYNSATPVCCGRAQNECCGSPDPEWNEYDHRTMDRFAPIERALRAAIAAARKGEQ